MSVALAMPPTILAKPAYGSPCNGCGLCCHTEVCAIGKRVYGDIEGPCPAMMFDAGRFICGVVIAEQEAIRLGEVKEPLIARWLGIGQGCDSEFEGEAK